MKDDLIDEHIAKKRLKKGKMTKAEYDDEMEKLDKTLLFDF